MTETMGSKIDLLNRLMEPCHCYVYAWGHPVKDGQTQWERYNIAIRDKMQNCTINQEFKNSVAFHRFLSDKIRLYGDYKEAQ